MKKTVLILMLLMVLFSLSGCVKQVDVQGLEYLKDENVLRILLETQLEESPISGPNGITIGFSKEKLKKARICYTTNPDGRRNLEQRNWPAVENHQLQMIVSDQNEVVQVDELDLDTYKDYGTIIWGEDNRSCTVRYTAELPDLELNDGDTVYFCVVLEAVNELASDVIEYVYRDPAVIDHPQTGDISNMLRYATLLVFSLLALCVLQLRKKEA